MLIVMEASVRDISSGTRVHDPIQEARPRESVRLVFKWKKQRLAEIREKLKTEYKVEPEFKSKSETTKAK